jgi:hypothetical protein
MHIAMVAIVFVQGVGGRLAVRQLSGVEHMAKACCYCQVRLQCGAVVAKWQLANCNSNGNSSWELYKCTNAW